MALLVITKMLRTWISQGSCRIERGYRCAIVPGDGVYYGEFIGLESFYDVAIFRHMIVLRKLTQEVDSLLGGKLEKRRTAGKLGDVEE